jgi:hypothetical protein
MGRPSRFKHALVRDADSARTAKRLRAEPHAHGCRWLEPGSADRLAEVEEIVGYHLEQAHGYRAELGPPTSTTGRMSIAISLRAASRCVRFTRLR